VSAALLFALALTAAAPESYDVARAGDSPDVLLQGADAAWAKAKPIAWGPAKYSTSFRALWSDAGLYLRFDASDPDPWWTMTKRDEWLWQEEVVEIFLDIDGSGTNYAEVEISPGNVICDVRMVTPWPDKQMDYSWNLEGIESRVRFASDAGGRQTGWNATAFLPWSGFKTLPSAANVVLPPRAGQAFRFNVFRVERPNGKQDPEKDAVEVAWSPPDGPSFHVPAAFRSFVFRK
jgi:Carbohydrate family 9 binding domain-like